ncbi:MAG: methyltransferase [Acidobacteriota bacterium]|nr:isoprenylcysteine carboxylmethyltransferase family protein [Blastocatellia bacterium]MDW8412115.1 methyltransferase [Acidobacteriota bacterium]
MAVEALKQRLVRLRVPLGFVLGAVVLLLASPTAMSIATGTAVALLGLVVRAWACGHLRKNEQLATDGPYAYTRNPLYLGSFLLGLGLVLAANKFILFVIYVFFYLTVYWPVMLAEQEVMYNLFPEAYSEYALRVPLFFPRLKPWPGRNKGNFDVKLYLRYREYRALFGTLLTLATLVAKAYLIS